MSRSRLPSPAASLVLLALSACGDPTAGDTAGGDTAADTAVDCPARLGVDSGIIGRVVRTTGNCMPGDAGGESRCVVAAEAGVAVGAWSPPLGPADVVADTSLPDAYGRYTIAAAPAVQTSTDAEGCFHLEVPAGTHSVLAADGSAWYCNSVGGDGTLCAVDAVTAQGGDAVWTEININYGASY